ncbi:MAG: hypothetical protein P4L73_20680 [Caulobacteraceae bacterium]|nr:hypothetical protein [Caulobacteraceae bacterium]
MTAPESVRIEEQPTANGVEIRQLVTRTSTHAQTSSVGVSIVPTWDAESRCIGLEVRSDGGGSLSAMLSPGAARHLAALLKTAADEVDPPADSSPLGDEARERLRKAIQESCGGVAQHLKVLDNFAALLRAMLDGRL